MEAAVLQGWKSIATYLQRDERTVRRWEKQHCLPIRRLTTEGRSIVFAVPTELDEWLLQPRTFENSSLSGVPPAEEIQTLFEVQTPRDTSALFLAQNSRGSRLAMATALALLLLPALFSITGFGNGLGIPWVGATSANRFAVDEDVLKGDFLLEQRTPESLKHARTIFEARSLRAPESAAAYAGLAKTYCLLREYSVMPSVEAFSLSERTAAKALAIDPHNSTAHAVMGFVSFFREWDASASERNFLEAERLAPADPLAYQWYGSVLMHQGRMDEALRQLNEAQRLAPSSSSIVALRAMALGLAGQRENAVEILHEVEAALPDATAPHRALAFVSLLAPSDIPTFLAETIRFAVLRGDKAAFEQASHAASVYRLQGEQAMWSFLLLDELRRGNPATPTFRQAQLEAMVGDDESSIADLTLLAQQHEEHIPGISIDPSFTRLRQSGRLAPFLNIGTPSHLIASSVR